MKYEISTVQFNALLNGTLIKTDKGDIPIENIKIGDMVLTHKNRYCEVSDVMSKFEDKEYFEMILDNGNIINITGEHPVYVYHKQRTIGGIKRYYVWFSIDSLNFDNEIVCADNKSYKINSMIRKKIINETLHNLAVKDDESYIANGIIVHNCANVLT